MNFKELYNANSERIKESIIGMWKETSPELIEKHGEQLKQILQNNIGKSVVVENMSNWESTPDNIKWRSIINPKIWRSWSKENPNEIVPNKFSPYYHQYKSWNALLNENKSIVVTSGTGSGKTECFMVPLIHDLTKDQKERMNDYITFSEKKLKFAVYNGSTPETGGGTDFEHEIVSRKDIRSKKPNILFTNPTMLEYMLLRKKDFSLFTDKLKWIVIDETHTFNGSAGAELALLLRRVLDACGKEPNKIKFATSSATVGDKKDDLIQFISDITGQERGQIMVIEGKRTLPKVLTQEKAELLLNKNFVSLDELIPDEPQSIEEKIEQINNWADKKDGLKVRLHFFIKSLNGGLYVNPRNDEGDKFNLLTHVGLDAYGKVDKNPLNAYYCKECGAVLGKGVLNENNIYSRDIKEIASLEGDDIDDDLNDNDDNSNENATDGNPSENTNKFYIGKRPNNYNPMYGTLVKVGDDNNLEICENGEYIYHKITKSKQNKEIHHCPCCGAKGVENKSPISAFYMSADFLSRLIAPILLDQTSPYKDKNGNTPERLPCDGKKYITFVDSRQASAGPTIKQNLETEEVWVTSVLYKNLKKNLDKIEKDIKKTKILLEHSEDESEKEEYQTELDKLNNQKENGVTLTWEEAIRVLLDDTNCERLYRTFDTNSKQTKESYALAALYRALSKRPGGGKNSPENWGIITTCYPSIEVIQKLPSEVETLNNLITNSDLKLELKDWKNLIKIFIDYEIRSNQSMFFQHSNFQNDDWKKIDINSIRSYRTGDDLRRPIDNSWSFGEKKRVTLLLCRLFNKDKYNDLDQSQKDAVKGIFSALKDVLEKCQIAEVSKNVKKKWDSKDKEYKFVGWEDSKGKDKYMNLTRIAFKLYDKNVWFDPYLKIPLDVTFKKYSPYQGEGNKYNTKCEEIEWAAIDIPNGTGRKEWFEEKRNRISHKWTYKLDRIIECIVSDKNTLYIQAEHTAQVNRDLIKTNTQAFKDGKINIMACSTTMEMGVDLGDLELVVMNNVPPHPANYKQRAGRAGRGDQNKSACLTICGNDAVGEATIAKPLASIINRPILPPKVGLSDVSANLVQRHINSLLFKSFAGSISFGADDSDDGAKIIDFFSCYDYGVAQNPNNQKDYRRIIISETDIMIFPKPYSIASSNSPGYESIVSESIHSESPYNKFCQALDYWRSGSNQKPYDEITEHAIITSKISRIIKGTSLEGKDIKSLIQNTKEAINQIANNIDEEINAIVEIWDNDIHIEKSHPKKKDKNDNSHESGISLYWQFVSLFDRNLMTYFSTHQFTPNANMPVSIVEMLIDTDGSSWERSKNPTRDFRTALSEYAPGNLVFVNGASYRMGGVKWNKRRPIATINHCDNNHTWLGVAKQCPKCNLKRKEWAKYGEEIKMITPVGYYPSKDKSRITQKKASNANIGVELIGVGDWCSNNFNKLYTYRTNENQHDSHILYFDEGLGYGYHICGKCGYAVPATHNDDEKSICNKMHSIEEDKNQNKTYYHSYLAYKCEVEHQDNPLEKVFKNIVLGGTIQTDYCEIALLNVGDMQAIVPMDANDENTKIGYTLGILLCNGLSQKIGFDRNEIDFVIRRQNGKLSICVFDVSNGGSGHSKLLPTKISKIFDKSLELLSQNNVSAEQILDRRSMRYLEYIDITKTKEWLELERRNRDIRPAEIPENANSCQYEVLKSKIRDAKQNEVKLYVNAEKIDMWNYSDPESQISWKANRHEIKPSGDYKFDLVGINAPSQISVEQRNLLSQIGDWASLKTANWSEGYKPLAKIGDKLYVTTNEDSTLLDENWASDIVWEIEDQDALHDKDWNIQPSEWMKKVELKSPLNIWSKDLLKTLIEKGKWEDKWRDFVEKVNGTTLTIEYTDRYLTSQLGMIITAQMIAQILDATSCDDFNIKITINGDDISSSTISIYDEIRKNTYRYKPKGVLTRNINSAEKGLYMKDLYASWKDKLTIISKSSKEMPHYRCLKIRSSNGEELYIMPDAGLAHGWGFDDNTANEFYGPDRGIEDNIPIYMYVDEILFYIERASKKQE